MEVRLDLRRNIKFSGFIRVFCFVIASSYLLLSTSCSSSNYVRINKIAPSYSKEILNGSQIIVTVSLDNSISFTPSFLSITPTDNELSTILTKSVVDALQDALPSKKTEVWSRKSYVEYLKDPMENKDSDIKSEKKRQFELVLRNLSFSNANSFSFIQPFSFDLASSFSLQNNKSMSGFTPMMQPPIFTPAYNQPKNDCFSFEAILSDRIDNTILLDISVSGAGRESRSGYNEKLVDGITVSVNNFIAYLVEGKTDFSPKYDY